MKNIYLNKLTTKEGYNISSSAPYVNLGYSVNNAGDINNDGYDDFIFIALWGCAYIIYGASHLSNSINFNDISGFSICSTNKKYYGAKGIIFANGVGDVNGDGYDDIAITEIGQYRHSYRNSLSPCVNSDWSFDSNVTIIFGGSKTRTGTLYLPLTIDNAGITITGSRGPLGIFGSSAATVRDINNDGISDFIISYPTPQNDTKGVSSYVVFGSKTLHSFDYRVLNSNFSIGFPITDSSISIHNSACMNGLGASVGSAGDMNSDGFYDFFIGDTTNNKVAVFLGRNHYLGPIDVSNLGTDFNPGFIVKTGPNTNIPGYNPYFGNSGSSGDFNKDGHDDLLLGSPGYLNYNSPQNPKQPGGAYIIYGASGNCTIPNIITLSTKKDKTVFHGNTECRVYSHIVDGTDENSVSYGDAGFSVSAGDVNGDGITDIIIGSPHNTIDFPGKVPDTSGRGHIIFGSETIGEIISLSTLAPPIGITLFGNISNLHVGFSLSAAGDINRDGCNDLIIGGPGCVPGGPIGSSYSSAVYIVYGKYNPTTSPTISPSTMPTTAPTLNPTLLLTSIPTVTPTNVQTVPPTLRPSSSSTSYINTVITKSGTYYGTPANDYFTINSSFSVVITGGGGSNRYIFIPHSNAVTNITDFNPNSDKIDLSNSNIYTINNLKISNGDITTITLPNKEKILLLNSAQIKPSNFEFSSPSDNIPTSTYSSRHSSVITTITSVAASALPFIGGALSIYKICPSAVQTYNTELLDGALRTKESFTKTTFIKTNYEWFAYYFCGLVPLFIYASLDEVKELKTELLEIYNNNPGQNDEIVSHIADKRIYSLDNAYIGKVSASLRRLAQHQDNETPTSYEDEPTVSHEKIYPLNIERIPGSESNALALNNGYTAVFAVYDIKFDNPELQRVYDNRLGLGEVMKVLSDSTNKNEISTVKTNEELPSVKYASPTITDFSRVSMLLNARNFIEAMPMVKYASQNIIYPLIESYLPETLKNISYPGILDSKPALFTAHLATGITAAMLMTEEVTKAVVVASSASSLAFGVRLTASHYLAEYRQEKPVDVTESLKQCAVTVFAYTMPSLATCALAQTLMPGYQCQELDLWTKLSFAGSDCYATYKSIQAQTVPSAEEIVVPYVVDAAIAVAAYTNGYGLMGIVSGVVTVDWMSKMVMEFVKEISFVGIEDKFNHEF